MSSYLSIEAVAMKHLNSTSIPLRFGFGILCLCMLIATGCGTGVEESSSPTLYEQWAKADYQPIPIPDDVVGITDSTRNFYIIMDGSGSMHDPLDSDCSGDQTFKTKMEGARWALLQFLESVPPDTNLGFYVFDNRGDREVVPLGSGNQQAIRSAINGIQEGGSTPLANAIAYATQQLISQYQKQLGYGEFRIIVVTDGIAKQIPEAAVFAAQKGMPIYTIGLCVEANHPLRQYSVSYKAADNFQDLAQGLKETLAELETFDQEAFSGEGMDPSESANPNPTENPEPAQ